jgi:uncharacterized protein (TIGR03435 family)
MAVNRLLPLFLCSAVLGWAAEKFEVASVRISPDSGVACSPQEPRGCSAPGGYGGATYRATNTSLESLVELAYGVGPDQISGSDRLAKDRYDISARPASGTLPLERLKPMLQALLEERFGLVTHRETKDVSGYALIVGKKGPTLKPADSGPASNGVIVRGELINHQASAGTIAALLSLSLKRPVVDKTDLAGTYDVDLKFAPEGSDPGTTSLPSIFTAVEEQLGLKLEPRKVPQEILVIDRCAKVPTEN